MLQKSNYFIAVQLFLCTIGLLTVENSTGTVVALWVQSAYLIDFSIFILIQIKYYKSRLNTL